MNAIEIEVMGEAIQALASGALWWPAQSVLCVSDLHLCKSERVMRRGGPMLPPYETRDTLSRLDRVLSSTGARRVICLGDSFDDLAASQAMPEEERLWLARLQAGREWVWIEGNHDPGPVDCGGTHRADIAIGPILFRHIARPDARGEISGHYHPKARLLARGRMISRSCFLADDHRIILPAFGTYTGGLSWSDPIFDDLLGKTAQALLTGKSITAVPRPRSRNAASA